MDCPNCGAPLVYHEGKDYLSCQYCTFTYIPEPNADGVRPLEQRAAQGCPVCNLPMQAASLAGRAVLYCSQCRGILIPMNTFSELLAQERRQRLEPPATLPPVNVQKEMNRRLLCPQCARPMDTHPYAGPGNIVIDNCPTCRVNWLDYKEFQRILTAPDRVFSDQNWLPSWSQSGKEDDDSP